MTEAIAEKKTIPQIAPLKEATSRLEEVEETIAGLRSRQEALLARQKELIHAVIGDRVFEMTFVNGKSMVVVAENTGIKEKISFAKPRMLGRESVAGSRMYTVQEDGRHITYIKDEWVFIDKAAVYKHFSDNPDLLNHFRPE
jgi:hypothetical protein